MARVLILYSSRGTNAWNLIEHIACSEFPAEICGVIKGNFTNNEAVLRYKIGACNPDIICLAGYMHILSPRLLKILDGIPILNIHPSLLPAYKGLNVHKRVLDANNVQTGVTVHLVTEKLDDGPAVMKRVVPILKGDTVESLADRVLIEEHRVYPEALRLFINNTAGKYDNE